MAKVNVSLPDKLLYDIDGLAGRRKISRSGFVQEATARYVAELEAEEAQRLRQRQIEAAMQKMRKVGETVGSFDGTTQIRKDRERDGK